MTGYILAFLLGCAVGAGLFAVLTFIRILREWRQWQ